MFECSRFDDLRVPLSDFITGLKQLPRNLAVCEFLDPKDVRQARKIGRFLLRMEYKLSDIHSDSDTEDMG